MAAYSNAMSEEIAQFQESAQHVLKMLAPPNPENTVPETLNLEDLLRKINETAQGFQTQLVGLKDRTDLITVAQDFVFFLNKVIGYYHSCDERIQKETATQYYEAITKVTLDYYEFMRKHYNLIESDGFAKKHFLGNAIPLLIAISQKDPTLFNNTVAAILITDVKRSSAGVLRQDCFLSKMLIQALLPAGSILNKEEKEFIFKSISSIMKIALKNAETTQKYKDQLLSGFKAKREVLTPEREQQEFEKGCKENIVVVLFPERFYHPNPLSDDDYTILKNTLFSDDLMQKDTSNGVDHSSQHTVSAKERAKSIDASGSCVAPGRSSPAKSTDSQKDTYIQEKNKELSNVIAEISSLNAPGKKKTDEEKARFKHLQQYRDFLSDHLKSLKESNLDFFRSSPIAEKKPARPARDFQEFTL